MDRPVIGMCTALEQARWSVWDQPALLLARSYVDAVQLAGGLVLMLPPDSRQIEEPEQVLDLIDGLVLTGGADIDPTFYGQAAHAETVGTVPERDEFEIALVKAAIEREIPVLGSTGGWSAPSTAPSTMCVCARERSRRGRRGRPSTKPALTITRASTGWARGLW